jgi:predicted ATPase
MMRKGWALAKQRVAQEGINQLQQGLATWRETGTELGLPQHLALLAEVYRKEGRGPEGLCLLTEAIAHVDKTWERWPEAELYRLKGEVLLAQAVKRQDVSEAEKCLHRALDISRYQHAKSLELRAAMSLSRLWQHQGKQKAAWQMLSEIYGWFTEGLDTADLQEAKALLKALEDQ